jgi:glycerophosphoryl diester phosphodiesterase
MSGFELFMLIDIGGLLLYVFLMYYSSKRVRHLDWINGYFAHRGLYQRENFIPENSLAAFQNAIDHHYGIELDIQLSSDELMYVFHDDDTQRMTSVSAILEELDAKTIDGLKLKSTEEKVPPFSEVLKLVSGRVPLLIELKTTKRRALAVKKTLELIKDYQGDFAFCSFDPLILLELKKQAPQYLRGLNMEYCIDNEKYSLLTRIILHNALLNFLIRPDYLSVDYNFKSRTYYLTRSLFKGFGMMWALPSQEKENKIRSQCETIIFEDYQP